MMRVEKRIGPAFAAAVLLAGTVGASVSDPVLVDGDWRSAHWGTVFTNSVRLSWDWETVCDHAKLEIEGMGGAFTTNFTSVTSNYLWRAFETAVPASEDVYTLTLTFYTNATDVSEAQTSRLAVVTGAFGAAAVNAVPNSPAWSKVKGNVVIPYDADFSEAATNAANARLVIAKVGGAVQTNTFADTVGYFGWKVRNSGWGYGTFDLALTFPETEGEWDATLVCVPDGTMILMR